MNELKKKGVNGLKLVYTQGPDGDLPKLDLQLLETIVREAEKAGLWVAVHAISNQEVADLVERSVTSIEHASAAILDSNIVERLLQNDIALVPTLISNDEFEASQLKRLADRGVLIGTGADVQGEMSFGNSLLDEIRLLNEKGGLSTHQALKAATIDAARILRIDHQSGMIKVGNKADLLLVEGNVLDSLPTQRRIRSVLIDGKIMKWNGKLYE